MTTVAEQDVQFVVYTTDRQRVGEGPIAANNRKTSPGLINGRKAYLIKIVQQVGKVVCEPLLSLIVTVASVDAARRLPRTPLPERFDYFWLFLSKQPMSGKRSRGFPRMSSRGVHDASAASMAGLPEPRAA